MDTQPHDPSYYCSFLLQWEGDNFGGTEISILNVSVYSFKINSIPHTSGSINILSHKLPEIKNRLDPLSLHCTRGVGSEILI